eukprot:gb/GECG01005538.1/.p1 GENE.gb/GECG01005538.1/~~gb/GECG01005538.1/.p1  ORF type:complete len:172 (+),score=11.84 gb/GECG01005538.1/:1-516(+)
MRPNSVSSFWSCMSFSTLHVRPNVKLLAVLGSILLVSLFTVVPNDGWSLFQGDPVATSSDSFPGIGLFNGENAVPEVHRRQLTDGMPTWEVAVRSAAVGVLVFFSASFAGLLLGLMGPEKKFTCDSQRSRDRRGESVRAKDLGNPQAKQLALVHLACWQRGCQFPHLDYLS